MERRHIVLETKDDVRFTVDFDSLGDNGMLAGLKDLPQPAGDTSPPVHLTFATAAGLRLLLSIVGESGTIASVDFSKPLDKITALIDAVRIAVILDVRTFADRVLKQLGPSPTCELRYAIGQAFQIDTTAREYHPWFQANHKQ